jgi:uncharacterized protein YjiS (DUF1127 family)
MVLVLGSGKGLARRARRRKSLYVIARPRLAWLIDLLFAWRHDAASWRDLATLNEHYLKDIGLSRHDMPPDSSPPLRQW